MSYGLEIIKVLITLVAILGLFFLIIKFLQGKKGLLNQTDQIKVLERCYLNSNQTLYLIKVVDQVWLVSGTKDNLEFIKEVDLAVDSLVIEKEVGLLNLFKKGKDGFNEK
ncbi:flagellar biosynthetic protein FliO [Natroniella sp. ANB-PHB2]|uniref:flagellar biosynthetic protein FliO n=1 Tax=Natroniella sp. ANB-PHB2 TaxID=3384444 RepID=UPI0038D47186